MQIWHTKSGYSISCILPGRSNVFLLSGNEKNILIDTSPRYKSKQLRKRLNSLNIKSIDYLILTHTHYDHSGNSWMIQNEYNAKVIVNELEAANLEKGKTLVPGGTLSVTRFIVRYVAPLLSKKLDFESCKPDILVQQRLDLEEFGFNAYILHTPGHSPGSQSVIVDDEIAIAGDSMFGVFPGSVFPPYADKPDEMIRSWGKLLKTNCYLFLPSHGTPDSRELLLREYKKRGGSQS